MARATQNHAELELLPTHFNLNVELMAERINDSPYEPVLAADLATMTQQFQRDVIQKTLEDCDRNWAATARKLSLDSGNLHRLAKRLGIK
ncbi:Anaerobic nitric oxide reductase transcription regulator NorR [compost metagenome]